jgi:hypothetical protein
VRIISSFCLIIALGACFYGEQPQAHSVPAVRADKAIVCFYRPAKEANLLTGYHITEGNEIAVLSNGTCCFVYVNPGDHLFKLTIPIAAPALCKIHAVAGQQYYILCDTDSGGLLDKMILQLVEPAMGESRIYTLRQKEPLE